MKQDFTAHPDALYNFTIIEYLMKDILSFYDNRAPLNIFIDRSKKRERAEAFDQYALDRANYIWGATHKRGLGFNSKQLRIEHFSPLATSAYK